MSQPKSNEELKATAIHNIVTHILSTTNWEADTTFLENELDIILAQKDAVLAEAVRMADIKYDSAVYELYGSEGAIKVRLFLTPKE